MTSQIYGDRWEIIGSLGEGGQAHTFKVVDRRVGDDTIFVLKRLKNLARKDRFRREIEAIGALPHPNIVRLVDHDLDDERPYLVVGYCAGGSLADCLAGGKW